LNKQIRIKSHILRLPLAAVQQAVSVAGARFYIGELVGAVRKQGRGQTDTKQCDKYFFHSCFSEKVVQFGGRPAKKQSD